MFHQYFEKPRVLRGIESADFESYLDSFAQELDAKVLPGNMSGTSFEQLATCVWAGRQRVNVEGFSEDLISRFRLHLPLCQCRDPNGAGVCLSGMGLAICRTSATDRWSVSRDRRSEGNSAGLASRVPDRMRQHRGVGEASLRRYEYHLVDLLDCLGAAPASTSAWSFYMSVYTSSTRERTNLAAEPPADQFGTLALPAHSQRESRHLRGRRRPAPGLPDHWAGSRTETI